jgi:hypothetical protein
MYLIFAILHFVEPNRKTSKSINNRFLIKSIEKLKKITSKTAKMSNSQLTPKFNNLTF